MIARVTRLGGVHITRSGGIMMCMTGLDGGGIRAAGGVWWGEGPARVGRMALDAYATAIAAREAILDEAGIRMHGGVVTGDVARAWTLFAEHATRHEVAMAPGDLERTNRLPDWDALIVDDAATQEIWRRAYPTALVRASGLSVEEDAGKRAVRHLEKQPMHLWNAFVPLALRRTGIVAELRAFALKSGSYAPPKKLAPPPVPREDASASSGERLPNLSDFARLQQALKAGDFMATLFKEGLDPVQFARISERWSRRLAGDPALREEYGAILERTADVLALAATEPLPAPDTLVFPGQKLARVSDFARVSRAATRGDFKAALERAGVDGGTFAQLCARFNARMKEDPVVAAQFKRLIADGRID